MLYGITGVMVWAFGPKASCPTYHKCWFGMLTCGDLKVGALSKLSHDQILSQFQRAVAGDKRDSARNTATNTLPRRTTEWSIKALYMYTRIIGNEIVVPTQKYFSLKDGADDVDVIIAQYTLTVPGTTSLEIRHHELYPSVLYDWTPMQVEEYGMPVAANIFLGGIEERCKPFTRCQLKNCCCGCDEKSFVQGTPLAVDVPNGENKCPAARTQALPLCKPR